MFQAIQRTPQAILCMPQAILRTPQDILLTRQALLCTHEWIAARSQQYRWGLFKMVFNLYLEILVNEISFTISNDHD